MLFLPIFATGQEMIKVNVLEYWNKLPAPPLDVKDAYSRLGCVSESDAQCNSDKFYKSINDELTPLSERIAKLHVVLSQPAVNTMQKIDPEEVKKKMAAMTQEEKIAYAMQMSQQMNQQLNAANNTSIEPQAVLDAIEEYGKINEQAALEMNVSADPSNKKIQLLMNRDKKHEEVRAWSDAEHKKIPLVDYGAVAGKMPDQKMVAALKVTALEKHLAVENDYLKVLQSLWKDELVRLKTRFTPFQEKLAAVNYGEDARSYGNKSSLLGGQGLMLETAKGLVGWSKGATDEAANWWREKLRLEKQNQ
jgi:hypothetical protein